jgi:outer membrane protein TolC
MMRLIPAGLLLAVASALAAEKPLTLEEALAAADAPHPLMQIAQADLELALADRQIANSSNDIQLTVEAELRQGKPTLEPDDDLQANNLARVVLRKTLVDFGREQGWVDAAGQEVNAQRLTLMDARDARRIDIMGRFFDVLLADAQYGADNEYMAVYYVNWDDSKKRYELGEMTASDLAQREARYQDQREKRNRSQLAQRLTRMKLANALNQPGQLPRELAPPQLMENDTPIPAYEDLLPVALQSNRKLLALQSRLNAVAARSEAIRASHSPTVDMELLAGNYSRDSATRDNYSGGLILNWPIYHGEGLDGRLARQLAERTRIEAEAEQFKRSLAENLQQTLFEISCLRGTSRSAAKVQVDYRDKVLERARAEYELEMRTNLGATMAETQSAAIRVQEVEYRLALAMARLEALVGRPLGDMAKQIKISEK